VKLLNINFSLVQRHFCFGVPRNHVLAFFAIISNVISSQKYLPTFCVQSKKIDAGRQFLYMLALDFL